MNKKLVNIDKNWLESGGKYICPLCYEKFSKYGISTHIKVSHFGMDHMALGNTSWAKGLTKKTDIRLKKMACNQKKRLKENPGKLTGVCSKEFKDFQQTNQYKLEQSDRMLKAVEENPDSYSANNVCGRSKIIEYNGQNYHSSWEVIVAKYFDKVNVVFERTVKSFKYEWEGKTRNYFPDFYVPYLDVYIEVKGYERERDRAKWKVVDNLVIIKEQEIKDLTTIIGV